jgi:hypothetical protein
MVFLVNEENRNILCVRKPDQAKEIVSSVKENGISLGIYGARNKELFLKIYPEFKGYVFVSI